MKKCILSLLLLVCQYPVYSQPDLENSSTDSIKVERGKVAKSYIGIRLATSWSAFNTTRNTLLLPTNAPMGLQTGLSWDVLTKGKFGSRLEVGYALKGAREAFIDRSLNFETVTRLHYAQLTALPFIYKPISIQNKTPYIAVGAYAARMLGVSVTSDVPSLTRFTDFAESVYREQPNDFGLVVATGLYVKKRPLFEVRLDYGLRSLEADANRTNKSISVAISL